jgi:hypothetical protein
MKTKNNLLNDIATLHTSNVNTICNIIYENKIKVLCLTFKDDSILNIPDIELEEYMNFLETLVIN